MPAEVPCVEYLDQAAMLRCVHLEAVFALAGDLNNTIPYPAVARNSKHQGLREAQRGSEDRTRRRARRGPRTVAKQSGDAKGGTQGHTEILNRAATPGTSPYVSIAEICALRSAICSALFNG